MKEEFLMIFLDKQILETQAKVAEKKELYRPYNILPLDPDSQNQAIMQYPEVGAADAFFFKFIWSFRATLIYR